MSRITVKTVPSTEDRSLPIFAEFDEIADRIRDRAYAMFRDRGFGEGHDLEDWLAAERQVCWPAAELEEEDDEFRLKVALAGFEPREISVTATPHEIFVKAEHESEDESDKGARLHWSEFRSNDVYRHFDLPADLQVAKISAKYANGMLTIDAPKAELSRNLPRKVEVSAAA